MSTLLRPYYYDKNSALYNIGYPNTTSAMYSVYRNWSISTIFKNDEDHPIKIDYIYVSLGMSESPALGVLTYSSISSLGQSSISTTVISDSFSVAKRKTLSPVKYNLTKDLIIPAKTYFALGFKVVSNKYNFLSTARTNAIWSKSNQAKTLYNGQSLSTGLLKSDKLNLISSTDVWHHQVPEIKPYYSDYQIKPKLSNSNLVITQGMSKTVTVSGVDGWTYYPASNHTLDYISISKSGNSLKITALYKGSVEKSFKIMISSSTGGLSHINVKCIPPKLKSFEISKKRLRPTESARVLALYSDGQYANIDTILDNNRNNIRNLGVTVSGNVLKVNAIADIDGLSPSDWRFSSNGKLNLFEFNFSHPKNSDISNTVTAPHGDVIVEHWTTKDISISFSSNLTWNAAGNYITYSDTTSVAGGLDLICDDLNIDTDRCTISGNIPGTYTIKIAITNDCVVYTNKTIQVVDTIDFNLVYPITKTFYENCTSYLPLFFKFKSQTDSGPQYIYNPYNYPLFITIPNNLKSSDISLNVVFNDGYNTHTNSVSLKSLVKSFNPGETVVATLGLNSLTYTGNISSNYSMTITFNYTDSVGSKSKSVTLNFKSYYGEDIEPFITNTYNGLPIQGQKIEYDTFGKLINNLYYTDKFAPLKMILMNYALFGSNCEIKSSISGLDSKRDGIYYIVANSTYQRVYLDGEILDLAPVLGKNQYISDPESVKLFEYFAKKVNNLVRLVNASSNRRVSGVPQVMAIGEYIMWDDSVISLADGTINRFAQLLKGDVDGNGEITDADARLALKIAANQFIPESPSQIAAADVNGDGIIDTRDVSLILSAANSNSPKVDTASPWKYAFQFIYGLQMMQDARVKYIENNQEFNVNYDEDNNNHVFYRG